MSSRAQPRDLLKDCREFQKATFIFSCYDALRKIHLATIFSLSFVVLLDLQVLSQLAATAHATPLNCFRFFPYNYPAAALDMAIKTVPLGVSILMRILFLMALYQRYLPHHAEKFYQGYEVIARHFLLD